MSKALGIARTAVSAIAAFGFGMPAANAEAATLQTSGSASIDQGADTGADSRGNPEAGIKWIGAESQTLVSREVSENGRLLRAAATPGAPMRLKGECPDPRVMPGWSAEGKEGLSADGSGAFEIDKRAPERIGESVRVKITCVKTEQNGQVSDREHLTAVISAVAASAGEKSHRRGTAPASGGEKRDAMAGEERDTAVSIFAGVNSTIDPYDSTVGFTAGADVDAVNGANAAKRFPLGVEYRIYKVPEVIAEIDRVLQATMHCMEGVAGWRPEIAGDSAHVELDLQIKAGMCRSETVDLEDGRSVPGETGVIGAGAVGIRIGGDNFGVKAGAHGQFGAHDTENVWGPEVQLFTRF